MPCRNEGWITGASIPAALRWCDALVVLYHATADPFYVDARVHVLHEIDPTWREAAYRQRMLDVAREMGATHVATVDADEILTANATGRIRDEIEKLSPGEVLRVPWLHLWGSLDTYRHGDKSKWAAATAPLAFRCDEIVEYPTHSYDIHSRCPADLVTKEIWPSRASGLMHLQHVSRRRVVAKQVLYRFNEVLRWNTSPKRIEARYGPTTDETGMKLRPVPSDWWGCERDSVNADAEPWQDAEVRRLLAEYGRERFAGLDLHGF